MSLRLLPRDKLIKTSDVDHAAWNYDGGVLGFVSRQRFRMVRSLLPKHGRKVLEIGYGSGIFLPELARHADEVFGVDVHDRAADVTKILKASGVTVRLLRAPAERLPFDDASTLSSPLARLSSFRTSIRQFAKSRASCGPAVTRLLSRPSRARSLMPLSCY